MAIVEKDLKNKTVRVPKEEEQVEDTEVLQEIVEEAIVA
jgi:hypothetical protein